MNVLVTGGAGFIGSHTCKILSHHGITPVVLDNLSTGNRWAVRWGPFFMGDISDVPLVQEILTKYSIEAVIHFAGSAYVGESMANAAKYFNNNLRSSLALLEGMLAGGARTIVFSSSCATYGVPARVPVDEHNETVPVNPYGETKLMFERCLHWYAQVHGLKWVALRYFNAAGADLDGEIGESHEPETHLIPCAVRAALGIQEFLPVYGSDYPTEDGTCIRDYVHVSDLGRAHVMALKYLDKMAEGHGEVLNLGAGLGHSVLGIVREVERVSGRSVRLSIEPRRAGDPPVLVASAGRAKDLLGWVPELSSLETMVISSYQWLAARNEALVASHPETARAAEEL